MNRTSSLALAGSVAAAIALLSGAANAADMNSMGEMEKCYGVSLKGHNDCKAAYPGATCAGSQKIDYDGQSFKEVPKGTCTAMKTPHGMGSLTPFTNKM
ncbi:MAG: DUF2282 domain-containing protein [Alphaproteobacteria bacterium]|nr:DUF2282 domain-containing protein [Alphaproteobacteria bacterium]